MREQKLFIGLVGPIGAGKGTVADYLEQKGFSVFSLSDLVKEEARQWGIENPTRKDLQNLGDELRKIFGEEILAKRVLKKIEKTGIIKVVIEGIRHPAEVHYLRHQEGFFLIGVTAPQRIRFERTCRRGRSNNSRGWEEFLDADSKDLGVGLANHRQNVQACLALADFIIDNRGSKEELYEKVALILTEIQKLSQDKKGGQQMYTAKQIQEEMRAAEAEDYETRMGLVEAAERIIFEAFRQVFPEVEMKIKSDYFYYSVTLVGLFLTPPLGKYYCLLTPKRVRWLFGHYSEGTKVRIFAQDICGHLADGSLEWIIEQLKAARGGNTKIREDVVDALLRCMLKLECSAWEAADAVDHLFDLPPTMDECGEASLRFPHVRLEGERILYSGE